MCKQVCKKCNIEKELKDFTYRQDRCKYRPNCNDCLSKIARIKRNGNETGGFIPKTSNPDIKYNFTMDKLFTTLNPKIKRCKWCAKILRYNEEGSMCKIGYCSQWCHEMEHPPEIEHVCKNCGDVVNPYITNKTVNNRTYTVSTGTYPVYCKGCSPYGKKK